MKKSKIMLMIGLFLLIFFGVSVNNFGEGGPDKCSICVVRSTIEGEWHETLQGFCYAGTEQCELVKYCAAGGDVCFEVVCRYWDERCSIGPPPE